MSAEYERQEEARLRRRPLQRAEGRDIPSAARDRRCRAFV